MPEILVMHKPKIDQAELADALTDALCAAVAEHLTCSDPDGELKPNDIEVMYRQYGDYDKTNFDVAITITATEFPTRKENLPARNKEILGSVVCALRDGLRSNIDVYVWTHLAPAAFSECYVVYSRG